MTDAIQRFFGGDEEPDEEEIDPEIREMAGQRPEGSVLRPVIFVAVMALGVWIYADWRPELDYFWSSWEPADVGDMTTDFPHDEVGSPLDEDRTGVLPHNRYVHLRGVSEPGIEPKGNGYTFYMLRGAPVYVMAQQTEQEAEGNDLLQEARRMTLRDLQSAGQSHAIDVKGRLIDMSLMPNRFQGFKQFFNKHFEIEYCSMYSDSELERRRQRRLALVRQRLRVAYEQASPDERERKGLKAEPTTSQIEEAMKDERICQQAYLLIEGQPPWSFWWYIAGLGLYGAFMLLNAWWLVRWVQSFARRERESS